MRSGALTTEQLATELRLEQPDRSCQRRLRDMAPVRSAREVQLLRQGDEISNLMHFHGHHLNIVLYSGSGSAQAPRRYHFNNNKAFPSPDSGAQC
jgi:hypothetical protein